MIELALPFGLAITAMLAGSILPGSSEAALAAALQQEAVAGWVLVLAASVGNTAGALLNWCLGRFAERFMHRRWFPLSENELKRTQAWYQRYGVWSLLASWLPFIGDPLTVVAGLMRVSLWLFLPLVVITRSARYVAVAWVFA